MPVPMAVAPMLIASNSSPTRVEVADAIADHHGIGAELLAERHRHGVLVFRAAHLQHVGELLRLRLERVAQLAQRGERVLQREDHRRA